MVSSIVNDQTVLFDPLKGVLTSITSPAPSGPGSNGNERLLHIPQSPRTGASPSDSI